jgi:hypothetical protein
MAGALLLVLFGVLVFTRTWWGRLPHLLASKVT